MPRPVWLAGVALAAVAAAALLSRPDSPPAPVRAKPGHFLSRPDLVPPTLRVTGATTGFVFMAPKTQSGQSGPEIVDGDGRLVWFHPLPKGRVANDLKVQTYRGKRVLTWWEGTTNAAGYGRGEWVIADASYREIARVKAGRGRFGDLHDMQLTERGTALITIYDVVRADLSAVGAMPQAHQAVDSIIQEVDVATGKVEFQWRSLDHVGLTESHAGPPTDHVFPYDYFHINSIDVDTDGNLLVSARNTWTIYKIDRKTGKVLWRLGGQRSDFVFGPGVRFAWQHDARRQADGTITLFDNESTPNVGQESRLLTLDVDEAGRTVKLARVLTHPDRVLAGAEGNTQLLPQGLTFTSWGLGRRVSELGAGGDLLLDVRLPAAYDTYRAFRFDWDGRPVSRPAIEAKRLGDHVFVHVSWNGATGVSAWQLVAGSSPDALRPVTIEKGTGFETAISVDSTERFFAVRALAGERILSTSAPIKLG